MKYKFFHVGYEKGNPIENFIYVPLKVSPNLMTVKVMENHPLEMNKWYELFFYIDGSNFALEVLPLADLGKGKYLLLVTETRIELRRHPRLNIDRYVTIKVWVDQQEGILKDISLGGCRVFFKNPILPNFYKKNLKKRLIFEVEDGKYTEIWGYVVAVNLKDSWVSFKFNDNYEKIYNLYMKITELIKKKKKI